MISYLLCYFIALGGRKRYQGEDKKLQAVGELWWSQELASILETVVQLWRDYDSRSCGEKEILGKPGTGVGVGGIHLSMVSEVKYKLSLLRKCLGLV